MATSRALTVYILSCFRLKRSVLRRDAAIRDQILSLPVVTDVRHPRGLDFHQQRQVVLLRDDKEMSWDKIVDPKVGGVVNLETANSKTVELKCFKAQQQ